MFGQEMTEEEMNQIINDLHENIGCADDDGFPSFLFDIVYGVDEDDTYYDMTKIEVPQEVLNLKRKYVDFIEWMDAMDIYHDYLDRLAEKYGSVEIVIESYNAGEVEEYVPAEPKLKPTKINKQYLRAGICPERKIPKSLTKKVDMKSLIESMYPLTTYGDLNEESELIAKIPKKLKQQFMNANRRIAGELRQENIHSAKRDGSAVNMLNTILDNMQENRFDKNKKIIKADSFADYARKFEEQLNEDPDFEASEINDRYINTISKGHLISRSKQQDSDILTALYSHGIDFIGNNKNSEVVKIAREAVGYEEDEAHMTKKQLKKYKKKMEKRDAIINRQINESSTLRGILTGEILNNMIDDDDDDPTVRFSMSDLM